MTTYEIEQSARALFDGGWRAEDKEQIIAEYDLTEQEAVEICGWLEEMAAWDWR